MPATAPSRGGTAVAAGTEVVTIAAAAVVFGFMIAEALRARRNEAAQRAAGGIEPSGDVYRLMRVAYPAAFVAMFAEEAGRGSPPMWALIAGSAVFALAKALKWWAILTLGRFWTFRVIVIRGAPRIDTGPYRFLRHPNYLAVVGELVGVGLMTGAPIAASIATVLFGALILKRIDVEERALGSGGPAAALDV
jgi:methyltransferase